MLGDGALPPKNSLRLILELLPNNSLALISSPVRMTVVATDERTPPTPGDAQPTGRPTETSPPLEQTETVWYLAEEPGLLVWARRDDWRTVMEFDEAMIAAAHAELEGAAKPVMVYSRQEVERLLAEYALVARRYEDESPQEELKWASKWLESHYS